MNKNVYTIKVSKEKSLYYNLMLDKYEGVNLNLFERLIIGKEDEQELQELISAILSDDEISMTNKIGLLKYLIPLLHFPH